MEGLIENLNTGSLENLSEEQRRVCESLKKDGHSASYRIPLVIRFGLEYRDKECQTKP